MQEQTPHDLTGGSGRLLSEASHLIRRFIGFLLARAPSPREQTEVSALLSDAAGELFWSQRLEDQRHAIDVMHTALRIRPGDRVAARAALLHDVGKRHARLGAISRSLATLADGLHLPLAARWATYRQHGALGARDLEAIGEDQFVVAFTRNHPGPPPRGVDPARWAAVAAADHATT